MDLLTKNLEPGGNAYKRHKPKRKHKQIIKAKKANNKNVTIKQDICTPQKANTQCNNRKLKAAQLKRMAVIKLHYNTWPWCN